MAFLTQRMLQSALRRSATIRAGQIRAEPAVVVLPVRDGVAPCGKQPVRIFLGTETAQYKAERVFIWSIEQVRDPSRVYEIYLMKHLLGFHSRFWLTGFTNYRFAIAHFAGKTGRAIYNDVDQIYLKDPAELFDLEMGDHAYLAIDAGDISVALFDCEKMSRIWSLEDAQTGRKNPLLARASGVPGQWGKLDGSWNARDREYVAGESAVLHYTSMHRQPWHPFPDLFVYQANAVADVWFELEESANEAGYQVFIAERPSQDFSALCRLVRQAEAPGGHPHERQSGGISGHGGLLELLEEHRARSVLDCRIPALAANPSLRLPEASGIEQVIAFDPTQPAAADASAANVDAVVCLQMLEYVPDEDVPWLLDELFSRARNLLYCGVDESPQSRVNGSLVARRKRTAAWWQYEFELVARHHPSVRWRLCVQGNEAMHRSDPLIIEGNECHDREAVVWVLANQKPGHTSQATALADIIGWPFQLMQVPQTLRAVLRVLLRIHSGEVAPLKPPWPNVIVACGWWPTRVARWIKAVSGGRVRLLLAGRKCGPVRSPTDILVSCRHFHLPIHERRIETLLPVQPIGESTLETARERGEQLMGGAARPRVALLLGGSSKQHSLSMADTTSLGRKVLKQVQAAGGSLFAVTSRRTGADAGMALQAALQGSAQVHLWSRDEADNPYLAYLAAADIVVVTGESESMLTDAVATGKPVYIYPLRQTYFNPWLALGAKLAEWSERTPRNRRGTERPQQGFEYLCSRILKREWILPPRDLDALHRSLVEKGLARMFGQSLSAEWAAQVPANADLGHRLRIMLAQPQDDVETPATSSFSHNVTIEA